MKNKEQQLAGGGGDAEEKAGQRLVICTCIMLLVSRGVEWETNAGRMNVIRMHMYLIAIYVSDLSTSKCFM